MHLDKNFICVNFFFFKTKFFLGNDSKKKRYLKQNAVPDRNLPQTPIHGSTIAAIGSRSRLPRKKLFSESEGEEEEENRKENMEELETSINNTENLCLASNEENISAVDTQLYQRSEISADNFNVIDFTPETSFKVDKATQTEPIAPFVAALGSDSKLNTATGLQSYSMLDALTMAVSRLQEESTDKNKNKQRKKHKLSLKDRITLTLTKLKQNLTFVMLSLLFGVTNSNCKRIFKETIVILAFCLRPVIPWPSFQATQKLLPTSFLNFSKVRVVLDCTEIAIQRPKCLNCRIKVFD